MPNIHVSLVVAKYNNINLLRVITIFIGISLSIIVSLQLIYNVFFNPKLAVLWISVESIIRFADIGTRGKPNIKEI